MNEMSEWRRFILTVTMPWRDEPRLLRSVGFIQSSQDHCEEKKQKRRAIAFTLRPPHRRPGAAGSNGLGITIS